MKYLVVLALFATAALAAPVEEGEGFVDVTQSSIGSYKYVVKTGDLSRSEERFADGSITGEYSIPGENGVPITFRYIAGKDGFKIVDGPVPVAPVDTNVPVPESPEIISIRNEHLAFFPKV